tara:strand:+ start:52 stop:315 length:264 start_codon:yes stop_codon:yes gene_type:complete
VVVEQALRLLEIMELLDKTHILDHPLHQQESLLKVAAARVVLKKMDYQVDQVVELETKVVLQLEDMGTIQQHQIPLHQVFHLHIHME